MQIICISRGSFGYGKELAERLAEKLGYECIGREVLTDQATPLGIPVGKIETAIVKHQPVTEALGVTIDMFKAFVTASLCERALKQSVVYHGRAGHLVLPQVPHVLRIRAIADMEDRVKMAMARMDLSREKAKTFNEQVDEDIRRWVRALYNVDWTSPSLYDITVNSARMSIYNSAAALVEFSRLPEFQETPASRQTLQDLMLSARCRLAIGRDPRTRDVKATVQAQKYNVTVTYPPRQARQAELIPAALETVEGIRSLVCTTASTNILYIQERFNAAAESFSHLLEVAEKWNAAVELVRLVPEQGPPEERVEEPAGALQSREHARDDQAGILDDIEENGTEAQRYGVTEIVDKLIQVGRAGGIYTVRGGQQGLATSLSHTTQYSLIVVGDVFLGSSPAVRKRTRRDLVNFLSDQFRVPVMEAEDLKAAYLFGTRQWLGLALFAGLSAVIYLTIFTNQAPILQFLIAPGTLHRLLAAASVAVLIPIAATVIGRFAHGVLKLAKME